MTFFFKKFTDADIEKYDSLHLKNPVQTFRYPEYWIVDEERDALMVCFGGRGSLDPKYGEPPDFFALVWEGHVIELESYYKTTYPSKDQREVFHHIERVVMPKAMERISLEKINDMVQEAFLVMWIGRGYPTNVLHIEIDKIYYV